MTFLQNIYGLLFRPDLSFAKLEANYNWAVFFQAILVFLFVGFIQSSYSFVALAFNAITWVLTFALLYVLAALFKTKINIFSKALALNAYSYLPLILLAPINMLGTKHPIIAGILVLAINIWTFYLSLMALSYAFEIPKRKALILLFVLPFAAVFFVFQSFAAVLTGLL